MQILTVLRHFGRLRNSSFSPLGSLLFGSSVHGAVRSFVTGFGTTYISSGSKSPDDWAGENGSTKTKFEMGVSRTPMASGFPESSRLSYATTA